MDLILASGSSIRHKILEDAGVDHIVVRPDIDESGLKQDQGDPAALAAKLAQAKAVSVSSQHPAALVIGGDSIVTVDGQLFSKPRTREEAAEHLRAFSGKPMRLHSAVALARDGAVEWSHVGLAVLSVRDLSDAFIDHYLDREWPAVAHCVGVFRMEGPGSQLFDSVAGGHFTILGMPLIPLLEALRQRDYLPS